MVPLTWPQVRPVIDAPPIGLRPTSPRIDEVPVLEMALPARMEKSSVVPSEGAVAASLPTGQMLRNSRTVPASVKVAAHLKRELLELGAPEGKQLSFKGGSLFMARVSPCLIHERANRRFVVAGLVPEERREPCYSNFALRVVTTTSQGFLF
jgi:hypothetical protein